MSQQTRADPPVITWNIRCSSEAELRDVQAAAERLSKPTAALEDTKSVEVNGERFARRTKHRFSKYFTAIRSIPGNDPLSLRLEFHRREDADRFWKDVMVQFLSSLREARTQVEIRREAEEGRRGKRSSDLSQSERVGREPSLLLE